MKSTIESQVDNRFKSINALIVKVTHRCNIDCSYCYENITNGQDMPLDIFYDLAEKALSNSLEPEIIFIFHGGEPTLLQDSWYDHAVSFAKQRAAFYNKRVVFSLQSNLIHVSMEKLITYKKLGIRIGASLDGPSWISSALRPRAQKALDNFIKAKELGINIGILLNINQSNYSHFYEIMSWMNDLEVKSVKANVSYAVGHGVNLTDMKPEYIHQAYSDIIRYMIDTKGKATIESNMLFEIIKFFSDKEYKSLCHSKKCGAGNRVLGVTTEGNILPCGRFEWNNNAHKLDSLFNEAEHHPFSNKVEAFHNTEEKNWINCSECRAKKICSYGCQAFIVRSKSKANVECLPTQLRYDFIVSKEVELSILLPVLEYRFTHGKLSNGVGLNYSDSVTYPYTDDDGYSDANPAPHYADKS